MKRVHHLILGSILTRGPRCVTRRKAAFEEGLLKLAVLDLASNRLLDKATERFPLPEHAFHILPKFGRNAKRRNCC